MAQFLSQPRALRISELLLRIFAFSEPEDNYSNACVCKAWSNEALAMLWRRVTFEVVLGLLGPTTRRAEGDLIFVRCPEPEDWSRFDRYAWRVHHLEAPWDHYHRSVFLNIASIRSRAELFPNLETLDFDDDLGNVHLFTHAKLKSLTLETSANANDCPHTKTVLLHLPIQTPHLETLHLGYLFIPEDVSHSDLASVLQGLPALESLSLPGDWLVPQITNTLALHPMLRVITSILIPRAHATTWDVFSTSLDPHSFPSLKHLDIAVPFSRAASLLSQTYKPRYLVSFTLKCYWGEESVGSYARFIDAITSHYPRLESLSVQGNDSNQDPANLQPMTFLELRQIKRLSGLKHLELTHPLQLDLDLRHVIEIAKSLPLIEVLYLNDSPRISSIPNLTMSALVSLISLCPKLDVLGLYVNACIPMPHISDDTTRTNLSIFSVGRSPITDASQVARFLRSILPKACRLHSHATHYDTDDLIYSRIWDRVKEVVYQSRES